MLTATGMKSMKSKIYRFLDWIFIAPELAPLNRTKNAAQRTDPKEPLNLSREQLQLADIYSFGMILYEILFRKEPFQEMESFGRLLHTFQDVLYNTTVD